MIEILSQGAFCLCKTLHVTDCEITRFVGILYTVELMTGIYCWL